MAIIPGEQKSGFSFDDPQSRKQKNLLYILGILVLTTGAVLYFGFFKGEEMPPDSSLVGNAGLSSQEQMTDLLQKADLGKTILNDPKFNSLSLPVKLPLTINPDEKGRNNPFEAF